MKLIIAFAVFFCLYEGLLYPCLLLTGHDISARKSKTLSTIIRWRRQQRDIWQEPVPNALLEKVSPWIPLSKSTEERMEIDLVRADIPFTPKEYYAKAILSGISGLLVSALAALFDSPILIIGGLLLSVYLYFKNFDQLGDILKKKNALLENEIPTFIRSVESGLHTDHDIIRVISRYSKIASPAMRSELEILIGDMNTSSVPQALTRFDRRMGSVDISRLVAALVELDRGNDATLSLQYLAQDMTVMHREKILRELDKRPGQMKRAILPSAVILVVMMFYMLLEAVIKTSGSLF